MTDCANPECGQPAATRGRKGRCTACYWHLRRHGTERPTHLIERAYNRALARLLDHHESHA